MNNISRTLNTLSALSLAVVMTVSAAAATPVAQDKLSQSQLSSLIATAKTPADHQRVADYYTAQAQSDLAQVSQHEAMIAAYKVNPSSKHQASEITHCQNLATSLKADAEKSLQLAGTHRQMANEAAAR